MEVSAMATTPAASPAPIPPKRNPLLWILGFLGVALLAVIVGGVVLASYIVRGTHVKGSGKDVSIRTPVGDFSVSQSSARSAGLPIYPGAKLTEPGASVEFGLPENDRVGIRALKYHTDDPIESVDEWYRKQLGPDFHREISRGRNSSITIRGYSIRSDDLVYVCDRADTARIVSLRDKKQGADITLLRVGKQEAQ
jgi:hypothetical protein